MKHVYDFLLYYVILLYFAVILTPHYCHTHTTIFSWWILTLCACSFLGSETFFIFFYTYYLEHKEDPVLQKSRGSSSQNKHHKDREFVYAKLHSIFKMCKFGTFMREVCKYKMGIKQQITFLVSTNIQVFQIILNCGQKLMFQNNQVLALSSCSGLTSSQIRFTFSLCSWITDSKNGLW